MSLLTGDFNVWRKTVAAQLLQHEKWPDRGSNPDPSGTAPDALPLSYQVLQGIAMWLDSPFRQQWADVDKVQSAIDCSNHTPTMSKFCTRSIPLIKLDFSYE